jgi:hypothetical protein
VKEGVFIFSLLLFLIDGFLRLALAHRGLSQEFFGNFLTSFVTKHVEYFINPTHFDQLLVANAQSQEFLEIQLIMLLLI